MGELAYAPDRLDLLRSAMRTGADELDRLACADPAAGEATTVVRRQRSLLAERWLPTLDGIRACTALTAYQPVALDLGDLTEFTVYRAWLGHWLVVTDPLARPPTPPTPAEVTSLSLMLDAGDPDELIDTEAERAVLRGQLQVIAADPALLAVFGATFRHWVDLAEAVATRRQVADDEAWQRQALDDDGGATRRRDELDLLFAAIGAVLPTDHRVQLLGSMSTAAATGLVTRMHLPPDELARAAEAILLNVLADDPAVHPSSGRPTPGDCVLKTLMATDGAPTLFVQRVLDAPGILWYASVDRVLPAQVLAAATAPGRVAAGTAERLLMPNITWVREQLDDEPWLVASVDLAGVLAPWLLQLSPMNDEWTSLSLDEKHDLLATLARDPSARAALLDAMAGTVNRLTVSDPDVTLVQQVDDLAALVGMLGTIAQRQQTADAHAASADWRAMIDLVTTATMTVVKLAVPIGIAASLTINEIIGEVVDTAQREGWLGAPDVCEATANGIAAQAHRLVVAGALVLRGYVAAAKASGVIERTVPDPPAPPVDAEDAPLRWLRAVDAWKEAVRRRVAPRVYGDLADISRAFVNPEIAGAAVADRRAACPG